MSLRSSRCSSTRNLLCGGCKDCHGNRRRGKRTQRQYVRNSDIQALLARDPLSNSDQRISKRKWTPDVTALADSLHGEAVARPEYAAANPRCSLENKDANAMTRRLPNDVHDHDQFRSAGWARPRRDGGVLSLGGGGLAAAGGSSSRAGAFSSAGASAFKGESAVIVRVRRTCRAAIRNSIVRSEN